MESTEEREGEAVERRGQTGKVSGKMCGGWK